MAIEDSTTEIPSNTEAPSPTTRSRSCSTDPRRLTVTRLANGKPDLVPQLRIKGLWLNQADFPIGSKVRVLVSPKRLVIELIENAPRTEFHGCLGLSDRATVFTDGL